MREEANLTIVYTVSGSDARVVWEANTPRADISVLTLVEDLLDDLEATRGRALR